jgi:probable F420-dependent oxidoreductase
VNLTRFGVWAGYQAIGADNAGEAARLAQDLGFGAFWLGGSPEVDELRPLLDATETLVAATGIVNICKSDPAVVARQADALAREHEDRSLIGVGAGHPEANSDYRRPRHAMVEFLDVLDAAPAPLPAAGRVLAALGPKMLDLAGERSLGSHPYFINVEHTRFARDRMGSGHLLAPELACVVETDVETARASARRYAALYLGLTNYTNNLLRFGFTEQDIADGGSDRLIDTVIPHGSAGEIAEVVHAHLEAGADHVCLQSVGDSGVPRGQWTALAGALGL